MTHRFLSSLSLSLLSVAALAGCPGSETEHDARFAEATDAQIERTYGSASGTDLVSAVFIGVLFSGSTSEPGECPTVTTSGPDTTVTGGCTTDDGDRWDGTIEIHNLPGFLVENPGYDPLLPGSVEFDLHIVPSGGTEEIDLSGSVDLDNDGQTLVGDFTVDADGIETTSRLSLGCEEEGPCTASPDSEVVIEALGGAGVEGTWSLDEESATGRITVRGADVLVFDVASRDDAGCVPFTIGDRTGAVCEDSGESAFAPRTSWASRVSGAAR
jgi:hypothetical protein